MSNSVVIKTIDNSFEISPDVSRNLNLPYCGTVLDYIEAIEKQPGYFYPSQIEELKGLGLQTVLYVEDDFYSGVEEALLLEQGQLSVSQKDIDDLQLRDELTPEEELLLERWAEDKCALLSIGRELLEYRWYWSEDQETEKIFK
ncbi:MAG: hypothetical protein MJZ34_02260 [Paludibacteraceae bacterium]|nr:hypothetical protein [Paludibacteraceae bacterium]